MDLLELAAKRPACRTEQSGQSRSRSPRLLAGALYAERRRRLGITLAEPPFCIASGIPPVCRRRVQNWLIGEPSYAGSSGVDWSRAGGGGSGAWSKAGPDQQDGGCGQQGRHGAVEDAPGAWGPEEPLERGAARQPGQADGEGDQREQDREDGSLGQGAPGAPVQEGGDGSDADQPPLGVDPLEGCHAEE